MLSTCPEELTRLIFSILPRIALNKCQSLIEEIRDSNQKLQLVPISLTEFVKHLEYLDDVSAKLEALKLKYSKKLKKKKTFL